MREDDKNYRITAEKENFGMCPVVVLQVGL